MSEKRSDSNDWLSRRRRDGQSGGAEPCFAQLCVDAPKARQRRTHRPVKAIAFTGPSAVTC